MSYVLAAAGFAALIILHEFGHFTAAKAVGMRVERFFLFFPPAIAKFRRGETEYGIGAIPLGGFVKITGMNPDEELPPEIAARGYYHQPGKARETFLGRRVGEALAVDRQDPLARLKVRRRRRAGDDLPDGVVELLGPEGEPEQEHEGDQQVHRRPGRDHHDPLPDRHAVVGAGGHLLR